MDRLRGKAAIVTGAASGIGKATAILFASEGARVVATDLDPSGEEVAGAISRGGGEAIFLRHDVSDEASWDAALRRLLEAFGRLDVLVNNAGISFAKPLEETTLAQWRRLMAVNLDGVFLGTREGVRAMRKTGGGSIVNVSSASGLVGSAQASAYCASKGAVWLFTKAVALEVAGEGIRVNSIRPGMVMSEMTEKRLQEAAFRNHIEASIPMRRVGETHEIAEAMLWLLSNEASFITGAMLDAAGGGYIL